MRVIKLGGSLMHGPWLPRWLASAAATAEAVIVPGGGLFADGVRQAQTVWGLSDHASHRMALLAMDQYGVMLASLHPRLDAATDLDGIRAAVTAGRVPVWLPHALLGQGHPDIPASWAVSSDSLALWLAAQLASEELLLVKSVDPPPGYDANFKALVGHGLIDEAFPGLLATYPMPVKLLGPRNLPAPGHSLPGHHGAQPA